jgi:hypothetical protein
MVDRVDEAHERGSEPAVTPIFHPIYSVRIMGLGTFGGRSGGSVTGACADERSP